MVKEIYPFIYYSNGALTVEGIKLEELAKEFGTPLYVYSRKALEYWFSEFDEAFSEVPHITCFAVKISCNTACVEISVKEYNSV